MKSVFTLILLLFTCSTLYAQSDTTSEKYTCREVMIPMRDGIKLHTVICIPRHQTEKLPFLMIRTPYGVGAGRSPEKGDYTKALAEEGYIFVSQDIRGRYQSEGKFEMTVNGDTQILEPGFFAIIPSNVQHGGTAITDCKLLDIFTPVREDYRAL